MRYASTIAPRTAPRGPSAAPRDPARARLRAGAALAIALIAAGCRDVPHLVGDWSFGGGAVVRFSPDGSVTTQVHPGARFETKVDVAIECDQPGAPGDARKPNTLASCRDRTHWNRRGNAYRWTQSRLVFERRSGLPGLLMSGPPCSCRVETKFVEVDIGGHLVVRDEAGGPVVRRATRIR